ncbi:hydrolase [Flavonifractor sp. An135]|nr:HAD family hydrolase [Flavonifractor sp. An135]OUQ25784.1 hydrolase [Flavonifractor sp. An135]
MQYRAVLFDFDFTLGDASEAIIAGFRHGFAALGYPVPDDNVVRRTIGTPLEDAFAQLTGCPDRAQGVRFHELFTEVAVPMQIQCTKLFPGAVELLTALKEAGVPAAIVSTKRAQTLRSVLEPRGVLPLLASVTGGEMVKHHKPDPEGLLAAVAGLGLTPREVLYCGDTVIDAETAQRAGADFCAVLNGTTPADDFAAFPAVHISPDLPDLRAWLGL